MLALAGVAVLASLRAGHTAPRRGRGRALDCASLVPNPVDYSPKRSPQAIHTALLPKFAGKEIVEIGTRNGDGMACFARVAMHAKAVEIDEEACHKLHNRSIALGREIGGTPEEAFSVICGGYSRLHARGPRRRPPWWQFPSLWWRDPLDADIVTWWQNPAKNPGLSFENTDVLRELSAMQRLGTIRSSAVAVFLFDAKYKPDVIDLRRYQPAAEWHTRVHFDEFATCCERGHRAEEYGLADCAAYARMVSAGSNRSWACGRARGQYHAIGLPLRDVTDALLDGNWTAHAHQLKRIRRTRRTYEVVRLIGGVALLTCILAVAITRLQKLEAARVADGARDERAMLREASVSL